jgi:hypothetical protein
MDDTLKVFDVQRTEPRCKSCRKIIQPYSVTNNCLIFVLLFYSITGVTSVNHSILKRKPTRPAQATWHPQRDDVFLVGCVELPKRVGPSHLICVFYQLYAYNY